MSCVNFVLRRSISTTAVREGKRNFKKFSIFNKRGTKLFKQQQTLSPDPEVPIDKRGVRDTGLTIDGKFVLVPEMVPELIVPDLKDFTLKPYVSYRAPDVVQSEFTAEDLFNVVYAEKIKKDLVEGKIEEDGSPKEPSEEERLTPEEAYVRARRTGSDIF